MVHTKTSNFLKSLFALVTNSSFMLVLFACGIDLGIVTTIGTLLNQILANYYDNPSTDAGKIGLVMFFIGSMAPAVCGIILDKFKAYRLTFVVLQLCTLLTTIAFTYTLNLGIICVYVISALLGFFYTAIQLVSFETAIELTYPEPETISIGIMTATFQIGTLIFTYLYSWVLNTLGITWANNTMSALNIFAFLLVLCIRFQFKREQSHVMGYSH
ncbi:uncharacterized MFS-type transporter C09D4.1-like [Photinus pyralis]|uniref:uncharacterized MFS-type transporter C09D4.1-like n=1 Tax=Photinus pyralis TaxID=7054 RepID=UPI001266FCB8|nr:uncharacterized MFS-type transporter C09D4.1-like [Photinus pyralis]XP_031344322.1 uncharacterized MFS-type transporter C09D4.1-like [Photinus pyralis]